MDSGMLATEVAAKKDLRERLYQAISPAEILHQLDLSPARVRRELREEIHLLLDGADLVLSARQRSSVIEHVLDDVLGFGPIEPFLRDPEISEVMVNGPHDIFTEKNGQLKRASVAFEDNEHLMNVIDKIVSPIGRRVDESSPMVDARLPDGSRVHVIIPPAALSGPTLTIRKFRPRIFTFDELVAINTISPEFEKTLRGAVEERDNILVTGGTGSGKTTLLNALSGLIPAEERIITIEDAAALRFAQPHVVRLEARPANVEGRGRIALRELVINALRMRPDRIVVGEVRGGETLDMLQAMNTGHDGSMATAHANSPREALSRLETMTLMSGIEMPIEAIRRQIAGGLDLIVHVVREADGHRRILQVVEVGQYRAGEIALSVGGVSVENVD